MARFFENRAFIDYKGIGAYIELLCPALKGAVAFRSSSDRFGKTQ